MNSYNPTEKNEPAIKAHDLLAEILPLSENNFIGDIKLCNTYIPYRMPNGQIFRIYAKPIG